MRESLLQRSSFATDCVSSFSHFKTVHERLKLQQDNYNIMKQEAYGRNVTACLGSVSRAPTEQKNDIINLPKLAHIISNMCGIQYCCVKCFVLRTVH